MFTSRAGRLLLAAGFAAACGTDTVSVPQASDAVSPDAAATADRSGRSDDEHGPAKIAMRDDCDARDPGWAPTGGCLLRRGRVTFAEFVRELSPDPTTSLSLAVVGHPAWRNDPTYLVTRPGTRVRVRNEGGRAHTYTEVAQFGGGKIPNPALNRGLTQAPECPGSIDVAPGESIELPGLAPGDHRFQCCIHPWMRGLIKVTEHE